MLVLPEEVPPCRIVFVRTGVVLQSDLAGSIPDAGRSVAVDSRGRIYTSTLYGGSVAVWRPDGTFDRLIGRSGRGPGELVGTVHVYVDDRDKLHVRDNGLTWSAFDGDGQFLRRVSSQWMGGLPGRTQVLDDGTVLTSQRVPGDPNRSFHIADSTGRLIRGFGVITRDGRAGQPQSGAGRLISYAGGDSFWVAPAPNGDRGYELELWSTSGARRRVLRRNVPWYPSGRSAPGPQDPPPPEIRVLHQDSTGLLFVVIRVNDRRWRWIADRQERRTREAELYDLRFEVIDPAVGRVLASGVADDGRTMPYPFVPRHRLAVREEERAGGLRESHLVTYRLEAR